MSSSLFHWHRAATVAPMFISACFVRVMAPQMRENASLGKNALLARCMKSLGEVPPHRVEALGPRIMSELTMTDRRLIDRTLNEAAPGVDLVRELECLRCAKTFSASLDLSNFLALA